MTRHKRIIYGYDSHSIIVQYTIDNIGQRERATGTRHMKQRDKQQTQILPCPWPGDREDDKILVNKHDQGQTGQFLVFFY